MEITIKENQKEVFKEKAVFNENDDSVFAYNDDKIVRIKVKDNSIEIEKMDQNKGR